MPAGGGDRNIEELKSLVLSTLETNGVLGQIRAQLRANVYKAIDCDEDKVSSTGSPGNSKLMKSQHGRLIAEIVAEFFVFHDFRHSLSVFIPEASLGRERRSRNDVASDAGLSDVVSDSSILEQLIAAAAASRQMDRQEGEQPQQQRQQQQRPQQKQHKQQQLEGVEELQAGSAVASTAAPSPGPPRASAESSAQPQVTDGPPLLTEARTAGSSNAPSGNASEGDQPATTPSGMCTATLEATTENPTKVGDASKRDEGNATATPASLTAISGSPEQEEGAATAATIVHPGQQDPQVAQLGDVQHRRAARSEEPSLADSMGGQTQDSFDEEFDRKMEEQIDSKIQRVNSCAAGDIAIGPVTTAASADAGAPMSPEVSGSGEPAVADLTGAISLDGSASESGQPQDLRQMPSIQSQSSPSGSHHSVSEDASPLQSAARGSPPASQSVSPSVSNESLRSPAQSSQGSHSQGSLQQPQADAVRREAVSRSQESSLHSELGQGAISGGSSGSSVANVRNHSRLGLGGAGGGSFAEDSDQEGGDSVSMEGSMSKSSGDLDLTDNTSRRRGLGSRGVGGGSSVGLRRSAGGRALGGDAATVSADEESFTSSRSSISGASEALQSPGSDEQF